MYGSDAQNKDSSNGNGQQTTHGIIPESIITARQNAQAQAPQKGLQKIIIIAGIIVIIAVVAGFSAFGKAVQQQQSTTTSITQSNYAQLSGCGNITQPGRYYLSGNIKTGISSGACINIASSNVALVCNQDKIVGSGPFVGVPPFTYGVEVNGQSNVSITTCPILNFSYGVYAMSATNLTVSNDNVSLNYASNIYLNNTRNSKISDNYVAKASGMQGAIFVTNGSIGNRIMNNTVQYNRYYGIRVNSSYNLYSNNFVNGTPVSFYCSVPNSYPGSSSAIANTCYNSTGCSFLSCRNNNIPANLSQLRLTSSISSCGSIIRPGSYSLQGGISMASYSNTSNPENLKYNITCIAIRASNVALDCMNNSIANATIAVSVLGGTNVSINGCRISHAKTGILLKGTTQAKVSNTTVQNSTYGILFNESNINFVNDVSLFNNLYGVLLKNSSSDTFNRFNSSINQYGFYLNASLGDVFNSGTAVRNAGTDVYATPDSSGKSYSIMQGTTCGVTNAAWATCTLHSQQSSSFTPVYACTSIIKPGAYELNTTIVNGSSNCIRIMASDVNLNCLGNSISAASTFTKGAGIYMNGVSNVTVDNCVLYGFDTGVNASAGSQITIQSVYSQHAGYGITLSGLNGSTIINNNVNGSSNASISLSNVFSSTVKGNKVAYGVKHNIGLLVNNSRNNTIANNTDSKDYIGVYFTGNSRNNLVSNNTMDTSVLYDYYCNGNNGINDENGGVNYGTTANSCIWMAIIPKQVNPALQCVSSTQPNLITLYSDAVYGFGTRCFSVYGNQTTINCGGHTVIATHGGTFAYINNSKSITVENCILKGFNYPVFAVGSSVTVFNNTISDQNATTPAISLTGGSLSKVALNNITAVNQAVSLLNTTSGYLKNNLAYGAGIAYKLVNVTDFTIANNTAGSTDSIGMYISKSVTNLFSLNNMSTSYIGMQCLGSSTTQNSNFDQGQNVCTQSSGCAWISSSSKTCQSH